MIAHARKLACPSFAAWLQVLAFTGLRPGGLDASSCLVCQPLLGRNHEPSSANVR